MGNIIIGTIIFSVYLLAHLVVGYYLGKRKLTSIKLAVLFSFIFAFFPPVNFVYFAILSFKDDIDIALTRDIR